MKAFLRELFSSDGSPSIRLTSAAILVLTTAGLEVHFATATNVLEIINSNLIAVGSYFGVYVVRKIGEKVAGTPTVDNSKTDIISEKTDVSAQNVNMSGAAN